MVETRTRPAPPRRPGEHVLEGQRHTALPGDVVRELVELPTTGDRRPTQAVLRPAAVDADADIAVQPLRHINRRRPAHAPIGGAGIVQVGGARKTPEGAAHGDIIERGAATYRRLGTHLAGERRGRQGQDERDGEEGTLQHTILHGEGFSSLVLTTERSMNELY